jgi:hypothetical protein
MRLNLRSRTVLSTSSVNTCAAVTQAMLTANASTEKFGIASAVFIIDRFKRDALEKAGKQGAADKLHLFDRSQGMLYAIRKGLVKVE